MLAHVVAWYPIFWFLSLTGEGKPVPDRETSTVAGELVNQCDVKCSTQRQDAGHCTIHRLQNDIGKFIIKSPRKAKYGFEVPNPPNKVSLKSPDETEALEVYITSGGRAYEALQYFLVQLDISADTRVKSQYLLLDMHDETNQSVREYIPFTFKCDWIRPDVYDIHVNVWALGRNLANGADKKFVFKMWTSSPISASLKILSKESRKRRRDFISCVCKSKISLLSLRRDGKGAIGFVRVADFPDAGELEIILLYDDGFKLKEEGTWWKKGNGSITEFRFEEKNLPPGKYAVKVKRHCPPHNMVPECEETEPVDIISKDLLLNPGTGKYTYPESSQPKSQNHVGKVKMDTINRNTNATTATINRVSQLKTVAIWLIAIIVVSIFVSLLLLVTCIIKLSAALIKERHVRQSKSLRHIDSGDDMVRLRIPSTQDDKEVWEQSYTFHDDKVPLIYTEDNAKLKEEVYLLKDQLNSCGVDALPVDEDTFPEIRSNWIDFGERLAKTYRTFLFVVSPLLYKMCHEGKYGDKRRFLNLVRKTKGQHIPLVLLRSFAVLHYNYGWRPRIFLVELKDDQLKDDQSGRGKSFQRNFVSEISLSDSVNDTKVEPKENDTIAQLFGPMGENTLSQKLIDDHYVLFDANHYSISVNELCDGLNSNSAIVQHLS